jgi:hypothetical protein
MAGSRVRTSEEFWRLSGEIALEITGAHHSSWNGDWVVGSRTFTDREINRAHQRPGVRPDEQDPGNQDPGNGEPERRRSAVQRTGTIWLDEQRVHEPIERLFSSLGSDNGVRAGAGRDDDRRLNRTELVVGISAFRAVLQAHELLQAPEGEEFGDFESAYWAKGLHSVALGVAEAGARADLPELIDRLPAELALQLSAVKPEYCDPVMTAAAEKVADLLGPERADVLHDITGPDRPHHSTRADVLHELNGQSPAGTLSRAAELALAGSPLLEARSPTIPDHVITEVSTIVTQELLRAAEQDEAADREDVPIADRVQTGKLVAERIIARAGEYIKTIEGMLEAHGPDQLAGLLRIGQTSPPPFGRTFESDSPEVARRRADHLRTAPRAGRTPLPGPHRNWSR